MGKTRDLFKKIRATKGIFHAFLHSKQMLNVISSGKSIQDEKAEKYPTGKGT